MGKRADSIDLLRGLAIVGMVLAGQMLWHGDLPAWLFHAQVPPPSFVFDPNVAGITWVDLVFPFFLFSMGAAFPLSMRRKLGQNGGAAAPVVTGIIRRWALLAFFSIALANLRPGILAHLPAWCAALMQLAAWLCFWMLFLRVGKLTKLQNTLMHAGGLAGLVLLMFTAKWSGSTGVSVCNSDIIILVLANMALFGSLVWLCTRDSIKARLAILALLVALRFGSQVAGSWNEALWNFTPAAWLFRFDFLKYLCIIIPGTIAGDYFYDRMQKDDGSAKEPARGLAITSAAAAGLLVIVNLWGLLSRHLTVNLAASVVLGAAMYFPLRRDETPSGVLHRNLAGWGLFWLMLGLCLEACEGGIKKDHATFSYFFVTSGLASATLVCASILMQSCGMRFRALVKCGRNPMVAYTAAGFLINPLLTLTHTDSWLQWFGELDPWAGVARGVIVTAAIVALTAACTDKKLYWRT